MEVTSPMVQLFIRRISEPVVTVDVEGSTSLGDVKAYIEVRGGARGAHTPHNVVRGVSGLDG